ncbi:fungal-specific transcription factor domain-containing protein, partial [Phycomyces nitens]
LSTRMALELGLNKENETDEVGETLSMENWIEQELRRRVFWSVFLTDKFTSAATGRPSALQVEDCDCLLPSDEDDWSYGHFYTESLDKSRVAHFNVQELRDSHLLGVSASGGRNRPKQDQSPFAYFLRLISLLSKVTTLINRCRDSKNTLPPYHPNSEFGEVERQIIAWEESLPQAMKNTPENINRQTTDPVIDETLFIIIHVLHNVLIILLHRPSLVLADSLASELIQPDLRTFLNASIDRCLCAVDNVTTVIKTIRGSIKLMPPFLSYLTYTAATIVVNNIFSKMPEQSRKSKDALAEHFRILQTMRSYWAMSDKLFFMIRDLYAMH